MFNKLVVSTLPIMPKFLLWNIGKRYIAGEGLEDAVRVIRKINDMGMMGTVDVLGESITDYSQIVRTREICISVLDEIEKNKLDSNISIKLTSLGLKLNLPDCISNVKILLDHAKSKGNFVRIDMEDSSCTDLTIKVYNEVRKSFANVGIAIQAYLRRTFNDIKEMSSSNSQVNFRLCKGVYIEPERIAFKGREEIRDNFKRLLREIIRQRSYVGIATHDDLLIDDAKKLIKESGLKSNEYEFQMLLGVRQFKGEELVREGHRVRIYIPFGKAWYGYSMRRIRENPKIAGYVFRTILGMEK